MIHGSPKKHVVVVGGGFGGLRTALDLERRLSEEYRIILVDANSYHTPHSMLYEVASALLPKDRRIDFHLVRGTVAIPFHLILRNKRISFVKGRVRDFDLVDRVVVVDGFRIPYEYLVLALGSTSNYYSIPGLEEKSFPMKTLDDALNLRNAIEELFSRKRFDEDISIVIGGGGFTGVELATELASLIRGLCGKYKRDKNSVSLVLLEAGPSVLAGTDPKMIADALSRLEMCEVPVFTDSAIQNYDHGRVLLSKGLSIPADILVWTAGITAPAVLEQLGAVSREKNFLKTDSHLRLESHPEVFAIGDLAWCFSDKKKCVVPPTAQRAVSQGHVAAENIFRSIHSLPLLSYEPQDPAFVVPLGRKHAAADLWGVRFTGFFAWAVKMGVFLHYLASILPLWRALPIWMHGVRVYTRND